MKKALLLASLLAVAGLAQAQSATYAIDPTHTYATFEIMHFGTSTNRARFEKKEGTVQFDRAGKSGKVEITFDMNGISSGSAAFDKHLQGKDFFDVASFGTAKFVGDKFSFSGDKVTTVAGELTLKGKTAPVTLKATNFNCYQNPMLKREVCGGDFETVIDRTQWGVDYGLAYGFSKDVKIVIQVEAVKQ
ncbi:YceI family protein [Roseateles amylovorans]|jgi:polyisoprenoid-binding protein YceI|uniref:YceI family protein n=1 Tax=Roseateles amylovorans TaxID=2978473 RepID=A0ABY6B111_9BURK|nr:YceI family protein [Roseateles amylovorans]UXH78848.1 YceI family protein [Roseateles amylovorans]